LNILRRIAFLKEHHRSLPLKSRQSKISELTLKANVKKEHAAIRKNHPQTDFRKSRRVPPWVLRPESETCNLLGIKILEVVAPQVQTGRTSQISNPELEECVMASAIALCWHLAAIRDAAKRDELSKSLIQQILGQVVGVEAAGIAINKSITIGEALQEIQKALKCADPNTVIEESMDDQLVGADEAKTGRPVDNDIAKGLAQLRRPLPVVMPPWTSKHCCELVSRLLRSLEETRSHEMSPVSDEEIELRARACHLAMCWFIGALDDDPGKQAPIESFWLKEIPNLVSVTLAVALAEAEGITVLEAINKMGADHAIYQVPVDGKACAWWVSAGGNTQLSGPTELKHDMAEQVRAADFLRTISNVIGSNVNSLKSAGPRRPIG
jgi:hypothetical protein